MAWAATWMYVATGTITYLEDAYNYWTMHRNVSAAMLVAFLLPLELMAVVDV